MGLQFANFGPHNIPMGGLCLSSFVLAMKQDKILLVKINNRDLWYEEFFLNKAIPKVWMDKWRLPATHLKIGEHPTDGAKRIVEKQLGVKDYDLRLLEVQSHTGESSMYKGQLHWDICFVYSAELRGEPKANEYVAEVQYRKIDEVGVNDLGSGHGWVLDQVRKKV
ncbi:MAG: NUDIX hydrolase [Aigarchaeota archaeon]|nr:NUDIX hydrolase [Aigarchaeota archaeon]MDW8092237.1 NUDIX hydrolase [Nitrososphaerota archaeon]